MGAIMSRGRLMIEAEMGAMISGGMTLICDEMGSQMCPVVASKTGLCLQHSKLPQQIPINIATFPKRIPESIVVCLCVWVTSRLGGESLVCEVTSTRLCGVDKCSYKNIG